MIMMPQHKITKNVSKKERAFNKVYKKIRDNLIRENDDDFDSHSFGYTTRLSAAEKPEDLPRK